MPSELQRVARGLVDCLDEVPSVIAHLKRTADRCRENAQVALIASHGRATVAAQQLDAAARACEAAAHYLSLAPPKARAWAEGLVGDGSSTINRPSADSADRNKATGGTGDVAERDDHGRTKRLTATFEDLEVAEDNEPPLVTVARKAFEKFRKHREKNDENRFEDPLEVEITIAESGEVEFEERDEKEEGKREDHLSRDFEITVDLTEPVKALLAAMSESTNHQWQHATLTITTNRVEATFDYPEQDRPQPTVVDIDLPELPTVDAFDFDPAFDLRPLEVDFEPGVHDPDGGFQPHELVIAERLAKEGWRIDARKADHASGDKNPDAMIRKGAAERGLIVEFKTPTKNSSSTIRRNISDASDQASEVVIDGRNVGLTEAEAWRAYRRAVGQPGKTIANVVHILLGDGRLVSYQKEQ
jgi:Contact-dependent growth inhibition CdiA C-terminal domain